MKILMVGNFVSEFGQNPQICELLSKQFSKRGHIITKAGIGKNWIVREKQRFFTLLKKTKDFEIVIIDVFSGKAFFWALEAAIIAKLFKKKIIAVLHGGALPEFGKKNKRIIKWLFSKTNTIVTPSLFLKKWVNSFGFNAVEIPNPLRSKEFVFKKRKRICPKLFWFRRYHKIYGPELAIKVMKIISKKHKQSSLIMAGPDSGEKTKIKKMAKELGVSGKITFLGKLDAKQIEKNAKKCDIFINTTKIENVGNVLIEAAAMGLPIVSTNVGGIPYLFENEKEALLVPPNNPKAMAKAIERLVRDSELANRIITSAKKKVRKFSLKQVNSKWQNLFKHIMLEKTNGSLLKKKAKA